MRANILMVGSSTTCPDLEYATGFRVTDPVVLLDRRARRYLVVPDLEFGRASRLDPQLMAFTPSQLGLRGKARRKISEWAWRLLRREGVAEVFVSGFFPVGVARRLERAGVRVRVARGELYPGRSIKKPKELRQIGEAQQAAVIAMRTAIALIAESSIDRAGYLKRGHRRLTSEDVRSVISKVLLDHHCQGRDIIVAGGAQGCDPHETGHGPLRAYETIVLDIFPQHSEHGYWGDLTRTVVKGRASAAVRRMFAAVREAQTAALGALRAGVSAAAVHRRAADTFKRLGYETRTEGTVREGFIHSTGHGVGLSIHESPVLGLGQGRLRSGNVVTVEPGLYYRDTGAVRIEDTVVVTAKGWSYLVPCEKRLEL